MAGAITARDALKKIAATRDELDRLEVQAWALYGDLCHYADATDKDRRQAFDAALAATQMLVDYDRHADASKA